MVGQTSLPVVASTATATTSPAATATSPLQCFRGVENEGLQLSIQAGLVTLGTLINDVSQDSNITVPDDLRQLSGLLDELAEIVLPLNGCMVNPTATWPPLPVRDSRVRVTQILEGMVSGLRALSAAVLRCDIAAASSIICQVERLFVDANAYWTSL
jgi:hypothetical protein